MDKSDLQARLMKTFLVEMEDHLASLNQALLELEKEPSAERRAQLVRAPFRAAHSLKGAARSVGQGALESCCQHLESVFAAAQVDGAVLEGELFQLLYETIDAIEALGQALAEGTATARTDGELDRLSQRLISFGALPTSRGSAALAMTGEGSLDATLAGDGSVAGGMAVPESAVGPDSDAAAGPTTPEVRGLSGHVRVRGDKLDRLLVMSGELQVARMRGQLQAEQIDRLKAFVQDWRGAWASALPILTRLTGKAAEGAVPAHGSGRTLRRSLQILSQTHEKLEQLEHDLERLRKQQLADRKELDAAAIPLEREVRQIRMLPFHQACDGLHRTVRDLAKARDRQVALTLEGGDLELDRSILESLRTSLLQLVRNAIDHGIEAAGERQAAGKPPQGQVVVSAAIEGNRIRITVADDGRGLDLAAVAARARQESLPLPSTDEDLAELIFAPGISTAPSVTTLSGRGVGLDIVKTTITGLRGTVAVTSQPGAGTRFDLSLPLTLSAFTALLIHAGGTCFAVDLENVVRVLPLNAEDVVSADGRHVLVLEGRQVLVLPLADVLGLPGALPAREAGEISTAVVLGDGDRHIAFIVDQVLGNSEVVGKPLGEWLHRVRYVTGGSVLPDGSLALILNAAEVIAGAAGLEVRRPSLDAMAAGPAVRRHLLVVEDSMTTRMLEVSVLESAGYAVEAAVDGVDAWTILQASNIDLVVSDVEMPRMDGVQLTHKIREAARTRHIPVILLTARETEDDKLRGMEAGADAYVLKSAFDQTALLETIQRLLP